MPWLHRGKWPSSGTPAPIPMKPPPNAATKADLLFATVVLVLSTAATYEAWRMIGRTTSRFAPWYYTPGFLPLILGAIISLLALLLIAQQLPALRAPRTSRHGLAALVRSRALWMATLLLGYVALLPVVSYLVATMLFLFLSIAALYPSRSLARRIVTSVTVSPVLTLTLHWVFEGVFYVPLP
jgi:hypothetical protein